jgi:hypothetical protein
VWYEVDKRLTDANLRSSVPESSSKEAEDPLSRYRADGVGIEPLETNLKDGYAIFRKLTTCRKEGFGIAETIKSLTKCI